MTIPQSLIRSVAQGRLVPFVGSGVSMAVKPGLFPSWPQLLGKLADKLQEEGQPDAADIVRLFVKTKQLNKAADEAIESLGTAHFREAMREMFGVGQPTDADLSLPNAVWSLGQKLVVTTNYDRVLEWAKPCPTVKNSEASNLADLFSAYTRENAAVWHVHGHIDDAESLILSPQQYHALYRDAADDRHPLAAGRQQLRNLILNHPLLFVGFGLQDEYVMDALATVLQIFGGNLRSSYALLKQGDDRAAELWKAYQITVVEYADHGAPLVELIAEIAGQAVALSTSPEHVIGSPPPIPPGYIKWLTAQCDDITPFGMAPEEGQSVCLQQVYVPPVTSQRLEPEFPDDDSAESAAGDAHPGRTRKRPRGESTSGEALLSETNTSESQLQVLLHRLGEQSLYVSGDPGTGKSTFCRWVAWLAVKGEVPAFEVDTPAEFQENLPDSLGSRLPVLVKLREFLDYLPQQAGRRTLSASQLQSALKKWLDETRPGGLNFSDVASHLQAGSVLLILDGVDELPLTDDDGAAAWSPRECVLTGLMAAAGAWIKGGNRLLVTSRPYGLDPDQVRQLDRAGLVEARMEVLPDDLQNLLAARWFVALPKTRRQGRDIADAMLHEVRQMSQDVAALTGNPLLLTAICIIYGEGKQLPKDIHDLYHRVVNTSLHSRYARDPRVIELVRARLAAVALGMHTGDPHDPERTVPAAEISYAELDQILAGYIGANRETESGFRDQIQAREDLLSHSGLLSQAASGRANFFHLSFQEFLAAEQLARMHEGTEKLLRIFRERAEFPNWRPTLKFLFARRVTQSGTRAAVELLEGILKAIDLSDIDTLIGLAMATVDGLDNLLDRGLQLQEPLLKRFEEVCLQAIKQEAQLKPRVELARMLGRIGDPRVANDPNDPQAWVTVDADNYFYGKDKEPYTIDQAFQISKYPVTNGQFALFVEHGYADEACWDPAGWAWRTDNNITEPSFWQDAKWNGATQPVVGISWWEADAFCRWAGIRLPGEREWEAAARSPNGLVYPWDDDWRDGICNSREAGLGVTTPVGIFPVSVASCGAHDMAGNVWEWCHDYYDPKRENPGRVLRGGSWVNVADDCRSSFRINGRPDIRSSVIGFRVART